MTTIRRIYAYLLAFAGLAMCSFAAANLLQLLLDLALQSRLVSTDHYVRDTVSLHGAAALVGLPVWLLHWLWIERSARSDAQERASTLRRLYLYAILAGATLVLVGTARDVLAGLLTWLVGGSNSGATLDDVVRPLPFTAIALGVWLAHVRIAAADRARVGERGGSATLRRWYVYGAALLGLVLLLAGAQGVVEALWRIVFQTDGAAGVGLARSAADALVGLAVWLVHWIGMPRRLSAADRRDDATSVLRTVYVFLALAVAVVGSLLGVSQLLYYAVARVLGVEHPGGVGGNLVQAAAAPASSVLVYGAAWAYSRAYQRTLGAVPQPTEEDVPPTTESTAEASPRPPLRGSSSELGDRRPADRREGATEATWAGETPRQAGVRRLYGYLTALVALGVLASGGAGLLWTLGDVLFTASAATTGDGWREQVALYATLTMVGLPVWLRHWQPRPKAAAEVRSLARRLYLYLSLIVAMLALVGSAAAALYKLLGLALGGNFDVSAAADLAHALAVASVAAVLAIYHFRVVRADARRAQPEPTPTPTAADSAVKASAIIEIEAADQPSLNQAMASLRSTGVSVRVISTDAHPRQAIR